MNSRLFVTIACLVAWLGAGGAFADGADATALKATGVSAADLDTKKLSAVVPPSLPSTKTLPSSFPLEVEKMSPCKWESEQVVCKYLENEISAGYSHTCGLTNKGKLECFGSNSNAEAIVFIF
jgi:hypothetical protein